jgi:hypothetical protein
MMVFPENVISLTACSQLRNSLLAAKEQKVCQQSPEKVIA